MKLPYTLLGVAVLGAALLAYRYLYETGRLRAELTTAQQHSSDLSGRLGAAETAQSVAEARAAALDEDLTAQRARASEAEARAAQFSRELATVRTQLSLASEERGRHESDAAALRRELAELKLALPPFTLAEVEMLQAQLAEVEAEVARLTPPPVPAGGPSAPLPPGTLVRVLQVGPGDAFVVLAYGSEHGARLAQTLPIQRGTETVAAVHISELQPRLSLAHVAPESLRSGLRRGDTASIPSSP